MSWKTMAVLAVLAAGLGGFWIYDTYWLVPARERTEAAKGRLWAVEAKDVEALTIKRQGEVIRLKRVEAGWELLEPVRARGDRGTIDGVVASLATARVDREIDPQPSRPADYGLDPPAAEVRLDVKGRPEPLVLQVGSKNPTGAWVYGREGAKPAVLTLSEFLSRDLTRPVIDFRDKAVLALDRRGVTGVDLEVGGERISLTAEGPGQWRITKPRAYRADANLIADFLDKLERARATEFVAEAPKSLAPYGLDRPTRVTIWSGKDKERASETLLFGRGEAAKKGVYAMRGGEPPVMLVPEELWTALPKTVAALRDKVVLTYAYDKVQRLELEHPRGTLALERAGTGWKITAPEPLAADTAAVNGLLWSLRDLRAVGFLADEAGAIPRYLAKPEVTVRVWEEGAKEPRVLLLKSSPETRGGQPMAVAAVEGQGPVALVERQALENLARTPADLRDRSIFPAFEARDVKQVRVVAGGKPLVVERRGESDWRVLEPARGAAKEFRVTNLLLTLKALRWKEIAPSGAAEASASGLDKPELEVSLFKGDGSEIGSLEVGRPEGALAYVRVKPAPAVYLVERKALEDFRKAPTDVPE